MARGCQDIFDLVAHGFDDNFKYQCIHIRMLECNETTGVVIAEMLRSEMTNHSQEKKVLSVVKDGGANLSTCTKVIRDIVKCEALAVENCFDSTCFSHIMSHLCNVGLSQDLCGWLFDIDIKHTRSTLQKCIIWTKKSSKGKDAW